MNAVTVCEPEDRTSDMDSNEQLVTLMNPKAETASLSLLGTCDSFGTADCGLSGGRQTPWQPG